MKSIFKVVILLVAAILPNTIFAQHSMRSIYVDGIYSYKKTLVSVNDSVDFLEPVKFTHPVIHNSDAIFNSTVSFPAGVLPAMGANNTTYFKKDSIYLAPTDGFVMAVSIDDSVLTLIGLSDSLATPSQVLAKQVLVTSNPSNIVSIMFPVRKGDYWQVTGDVDKLIWRKLD